MSSSASISIVAPAGCSGSSVTIRPCSWRLFMNTFQQCSPFMVRSSAAARAFCIEVRQEA